MKNLFSIVLSIVFFTTGKAASTEVPRTHSPDCQVSQTVLASFKKLYGNVTHERWKSQHGICTAKFKMNNRVRIAYFDTAGEWLKTETKLPWSWTLPKSVQKGFNASKYAAWYIERIAKVDSTDGSSYYALDVHLDLAPEGAIPEDWRETMQLDFDEQGTLIKSEKKP